MNNNPKLYPYLLRDTGINIDTISKYMEQWLSG